MPKLSPRLLTDTFQPIDLLGLSPAVVLPLPALMAPTPWAFQALCLAASMLLFTVWLGARVAFGVRAA